MHEQGHERYGDRADAPDSGREEELAARQDRRLYPIGQALRATFDAENHDTLGRDVTGLMMKLSHVDVPEPSSAPPAATPVRSTSWLERVNVLFGRRRDH